MRPQLTSAAFVSILILAGCSSTVRRSPPIATAPGAQTGAAAAARVASATTGTSAAGTSEAEALNQAYLKRGYKPMRNKGQLLYCRKEQLTGTTFKNNVCLTENQIKERDDIAREAGREMDRQRSPGCVAPMPCR